MKQFESKGLSELIDPWTKVVQVHIPTGPKETKPSGYCTFVVDGKIVQRSIGFAAFNPKFNTCKAIIYKQMTYYIDVPMKPISGAFNVQSLQVL